MVAKRCSNRRSACPVEFALDVFGDRWTLLIIRDMLFMGKRHFREFRESAEGIAANILSDRLKRLVAHGILEGREDPRNRRQIVYSLTAKGRDLVPTILEMIRWGAKYDVNSVFPLEMLERIESDRDQYGAELLARLDTSTNPAGG